MAAGLLLCVDSRQPIVGIQMKRQGNKLTAAAVRGASKPGLYPDGYGLALQVSDFDTKAWVFRFMIAGRARKMGLGPLNTTSLAKARERAQKARDLLAEGIDPLEARDANRLQKRVEAAKSMTFKQCADAYIKANRSGWKNDKHSAQWSATFNETKRGKRVYPAATAVINDLPVSAIDTGLVRKVLEPIWYETPETASRVRGRIERVLAWATVAGYRSGDNPARWTGHLKELLPSRTKLAAVEHHSAIPYRDMPPFMAELRAKHGTSASALEFCILSVSRTSEVLGARWTEIDLNAKLWTVPAIRMKAGKEHRIPLSDRAIAILEASPREGEYVFPGARHGKPLAHTALLVLLQGMRGRGLTVHGLRSTFRDWAAEQTAYPHELCEIALAHAVGNKVEAAYRRGDMMEKRRRLMSDWAEYCEQPPAERGRVVPIREAAR
jgi:integrase